MDFAGQFAELRLISTTDCIRPPTYNYSFAFSIRIPLLNLAQNARAAAADADALHAEADAQAARDQVARRPSKRSTPSTGWRPLPGFRTWNSM